MKLSKYTILTVILLGAYLLSACSGAPAPSSSSVVDDTQSGQFQEVVFTGVVEAVGNGEWQVSGQQVPVDPSTVIDANIQVGDTVRVEASVSPDGSVVALKIESASADDGSSNTNANSNDDNSNDAASNDNVNTNDNTNSSDDNGNSNTNANSNDGMSGSGDEVYGVVEVITSDSITIDGVTYSLADFTEFNDLVAVGDQVVIHVIVNSDGTVTISEIELSTSIGGNSNDDNSNINGSDDNSNNNSNDDDHDDDNSNSNSNDDDHDDDSNNNSNSNDD